VHVQCTYARGYRALSESEIHGLSQAWVGKELGHSGDYPEQPFNKGISARLLIVSCRTRLYTQQR
jgi:hypothetical protein